MLSVHYALSPDFPADYLWEVALQLTDADICVPVRDASSATSPFSTLRHTKEVF